MIGTDFDIDGLARYLHITPQQVERLVTRGKLPGRKVGGQWRFASAEIHHWMEERMGLLEDDELARVEDAMTDQQPGLPSEVSLCDLLSESLVAVPLAGRTKGSVIDQITQLAARTGLLWDAEKMAAAIRAREQMQSTAMDNGVALLHPRRPMPSILGQPLLALGIAPHPVPFGGGSRLTDIFFLICSTDDRSHLRTLARLARLVNQQPFLDALRAATSPAEAVQAIKQAEVKLEQ